MCILALSKIYESMKCILVFKYSVLLFFVISSCTHAQLPPGTPYDPDAPRNWEASAQERIRKYRMADVRFNISSKRPVTIEIQQRRHAFPFGSAVIAHHLLDSSQDAQQYRQIVARNFNQVVLENDLKWHWFTPKPGRGRSSIPTTLQALAYLKAQRIEVRGHYLHWGPYMKIDSYRPLLDSATHANPEAFRRKLVHFIDTVLTLTQNDVNEWDALNHPVHRNLKDQMRDKAGRGVMVHEWLQRDVYAEVLRQAHRKNPRLRLYLNESDILTRPGTRFMEYTRLIRQLKERKLPVHGIGCMAHFKPENLPSMATLEARLDSLAKLRLPIKITEFDVQFGQPMRPYAQTAQELQLQKRYTEDFLMMCFSHPAVVGILMWGFWEKAHYHPAAALWDSAWNIKPNGQAWREAVFQKWWSHHTVHQSVSRQKYQVRLFHGEHELRISDSETGEELYRSTLFVGEKGQNLSVNIRKSSEIP